MGQMMRMMGGDQTPSVTPPVTPAPSAGPPRVMPSTTESAAEVGDDGVARVPVTDPAQAARMTGEG
jgi:hypothetical protein